MKLDFVTRELSVMVGDITPYVSLTDGDAYPEYTLTETEAVLHLHAESPDFSDDLYFKKEVCGVSARRLFKNRSRTPLQLRELGCRIDGIDFGKTPRNDYYYHAENPRVFDHLVLRVDQKRKETATDGEYDEVAGNKWADAGVIVDRVGACPYQPFPAILLSNLDTGYGLVHGTLSQNVFYHCYLPYHGEAGLTLDIYSAFKDIDYRIVKPAETLIDEWYLGYTEHADDLEQIFSEYSSVLRRYLPANYGATSINRDNLVWGTWNDGISRKVNEQLVLDEAEALVKYFPNVRWLQLDDGYCAHDSQCGFKAHGLGVPYEGEEGIAYAKFPHGLRYLSDKIREIGLRPAIWIGGFCPRDTKIATERPDLMCQYKFRSGNGKILDVSLPEARDYMMGALDTLILDYGFEGVKHDFWSYAFEVSEPLLSGHDMSGYEYRRWWLSEVRKRMPGDAYFQTGCDIVMANPFLGEFFTNYRYGIDIGAGVWRNLKTNYLWCIACLATHTGDLFVPNSDAVGMFPGLSDRDAEFCVNFVLITRTMVELAGKFSEVDPENPRFKMLRKATANINNGEDVYFADYDYRTADTEPPSTLYIKTPYFASEETTAAPMRTVAIFNLDDDHNKSIKLTRVGLKLPVGEYIITNVWTGEQLLLTDETEISLEPHESRLFTVSSRDTALILDSNVKLSDICECDGTLTATLHYPAECELTLTREPLEIFIDSAPVPFTYADGVVSFASACGKLSITFK